jgi:hypothetical protein
MQTDKERVAAWLAKVDEVIDSAPKVNDSWAFTLVLESCELLRGAVDAIREWSR